MEADAESFLTSIYDSVVQLKNPHNDSDEEDKAQQENSEIDVIGR